MTTPPSLLTCRYWAFGPKCPNIDKDGSIYCAWAHWDTGHLASEMDQRGTCRYWLQGCCRNGQNCWYEHRKTGVDAMYQGPISLTAFNLEVANAAAKSGFNTWNHSALFDLIWSVKRVALRHCRGKDLDFANPRDPFYPDKYRPSGFGDNTNRKRPAPPVSPPITSTVELGQRMGPLRTRLRSFRYKNKRKTVAPHSVLRAGGEAFVEEDTEADLTGLLTDEESSDTVSKKQKVDANAATSIRNGANQSRSRISAPNIQASAKNYNWASTTKHLAFGSESTTRLGCEVHHLKFQDATNFVPYKPSVRTSTQRASFVPFVKSDQNREEEPYKQVSLQSRKFLTGQIDFVRNPRSHTDIPVELDVVRSKLDGVVEEVGRCRCIMRNTYERYSDILGGDETIEDLRALSQHFETAEEEAKTAIERVDCVYELVFDML